MGARWARESEVCPIQQWAMRRGRSAPWRAPVGGRSACPGWPPGSTSAHFDETHAHRVRPAAALASRPATNWADIDPRSPSWVVAPGGSSPMAGTAQRRGAVSDPTFTLRKWQFSSPSLHMAAVARDLAPAARPGTASLITDALRWTRGIPSTSSSASFRESGACGARRSSGKSATRS